MPFEQERFIAKRPYCVHRTHVDNVAAIRTQGQLLPAAHLYAAAGVTLPRARRQSLHDRTLQCDFGTLILNDQDPFQEKYGRFDDGMTADEFRQELDRKVFFWPFGRRPTRTKRAAESVAMAFLAKYSSSSAWIIVPTRELFDANRNVVPRYSWCNSGTLSARLRTINVRGRSTFLPCEKFVGTLSRVREVVFDGPVRLPACTEFVLPSRSAHEGDTIRMT